MNGRTELDNIKESYYSILLAFKVTKDVLNEVEDEDVIESRNSLYERLSTLIPRNEYDIFNSTVIIYQMDDDYNYLIVYSSFIRGLNRLPMDGYVNVRDIKESIKNEFQEFFKSINIDYKLTNIKSLV